MAAMDHLMVNKAFVDNAQTSCACGLATDPANIDTRLQQFYALSSKYKDEVD